MKSPVLEVKDVSTTVLHDVRLLIEKGEFVALIAPSGSGKSTLLSLICGMESPSSGQILVNGDDIHRIQDMDNWRAANIGLILEENNLIPSLNVYENVELPMAVRGIDREKRKQSVHSALEHVGLNEKERVYPKRLTMQEEQLAALARAIASDPTIILADEPTGKLNDEQTNHFIGLIGRINKAANHTFMVASHDQRWKESASRVVALAS
jgi:ABC-type lipoprotein export system ATPase subunit